MGNIFDGYSRSKATMQLAQMAAKGLISQEEIEQFSEETQTFVQSFLDIGT
jgi:tape measure domain-containing protein